MLNTHTPLVSATPYMALTADTVHQYPRTTPELYADKVAPMVEKAMAGFNSTVFA